MSKQQTEMVDIYAYQKCVLYNANYSLSTGCSFPSGRVDTVRRKCRYLTGNIHEFLHIDENM